MQDSCIIGTYGEELSSVFHTVVRNLYWINITDVYENDMTEEETLSGRLSDFRNKAEPNKEVCMLINRNNIVVDYLKGLEKIAKINENILVCKDSGVISKAKSGVMITDENIYFLEKRGIAGLALRDVMV